MVMAGITANIRMRVIISLCLSDSRPDEAISHTPYIRTNLSLPCLIREGLIKGRQRCFTEPMKKATVCWSGIADSRPPKTALLSKFCPALRSREGKLWLIAFSLPPFFT